MTINPAAAGLTLYRQLAAAVHADTLTRSEALELANTTPDGQIAQIALDRVWGLDHEMGCGCDTPEAHVASDYAVLPGDDLDEALSLELVRRETGTQPRFSDPIEQTNFGGEDEAWVPGELYLEM